MPLGLRFRRSAIISAEGAFHKDVEAGFSLPKALQRPGRSPASRA